MRTRTQDNNPMSIPDLRLDDVIERLQGFRSMYGNIRIRVGTAAGPVSKIQHANRGGKPFVIIT